MNRSIRLKSSHRNPFAKPKKPAKAKPVDRDRVPAKKKRK